MGFAWLPEGVGDCSALTTLILSYNSTLAALPERLSDCAVLMAL